MLIEGFNQLFHAVNVLGPLPSGKVLYTPERLERHIIRVVAAENAREQEQFLLDVPSQEGIQDAVRELVRMLDFDEEGERLRRHIIAQLFLSLLRDEERRHMKEYHSDNSARDMIQRIASSRYHSTKNNNNERDKLS